MDEIIGANLLWCNGFFSVCTCNTEGTEAATCGLGTGNCSCNDESGACDCIANVVGNACDQCAANHFAFPTCEGKCPISLK